MYHQNLQPGLIDYWSQHPPPSSHGWGGFPPYYSNPPVVSQNAWIPPLFSQHQPPSSYSPNPFDPRLMRGVENNFRIDDYDYSNDPVVTVTTSQTPEDTRLPTRTSSRLANLPQQTSILAPQVGNRQNKIRFVWESKRPDKRHEKSSERHDNKKDESYNIDALKEEKDLEILTILNFRMRIKGIKIPVLADRIYLQKFSEAFNDFLNAADPVPLLTKVVLQLVYCSEDVRAIRLVKLHISSKLVEKNNLLNAHSKMRTFWVLGEIYRHEYDCRLVRVRSILSAHFLFKKFLNRNWKHVHRTYEPELQAIWSYWKQYVPRYMLESILRDLESISCKNCLQSGPTYASLESFYKLCNRNRASSPSNSRQSKKWSTSSIGSHSVSRVESKKTVFDRLGSRGSKPNPRMNIEKRIAAKPPPDAEKPKYIAPRNGPPSVTCKNLFLSSSSLLETDQSSRPNKNAFIKPKSTKASTPPTEVERAVLSFSTKMENLLTIDRTQKVPQAASEVLFQILDFGTNKELCEEIIVLIKGYVFGTESKGFTDQKVIRILWVIGYLFFPAYRQKVTAMRDLLEKIAPNLFWICVKKINNIDDHCVREEMRVILHFWKDVMKPEIISAIQTRLCSIYSGKPLEQYNWVLDDKDIKKDSRISEFYSNNYLGAERPKSPESTKAKKDHSKPVARVGPTAPVETACTSNSNSESISLHDSSDNETEIVILDKRDTIGQKSTLKNAAWEDKLVKKSSKVLVDDQHIQPKKKKLKKKEETTPNLFTEFIRLPSQPKPTPTTSILPTAESKKDDSKKSYTIVKDKTRFDLVSTSTSGGSKQPAAPAVSKLELFRKQMEKDEAIKTVSYSWNDTFGGSKGKYLRQDWSVDEFVSYALSDDVKKWDIVKLPNGESRIRVEKK